MQQDTNDHQLPPVGGQSDTNQMDDLSGGAMQQNQPLQGPTQQPQSVTVGSDQPPYTDLPTAGIDALSAEDVDLIEKVWVEKAKEIVQSTLGDPYKQNQQLSEVKAAYIKKRYSKDIKVSEQGQ